MLLLIDLLSESQEWTAAGPMMTKKNTKPFRPHHPYGQGGRPSRAKWTDFVVDGRTFEVLGIRDPAATMVRSAGWPNVPDEQIGEALVALVKGWA